MTKGEIRSLLVKSSSGIPNLDLNLLQAFIMTESSYRPEVTRFEPEYKYSCNIPFYAKRNKPDPDPDKSILIETKNQHTSWGLFQIMGCAARELGFLDDLSQLLKPEINMIWGIEFYRVRCKARYNLMEDQIAAYNAGTAIKNPDGTYFNQGYLDKVLSAYHSLS